MNIKQAILENIKQLFVNQKQEVLDFSEFLKQKHLTLKENSQTKLTPEEKSEKWVKWVQSHTSNNPPLPDSALHRDTMYEDEY